MTPAQLAAIRERVEKANQEAAATFREEQQQRNRPYLRPIAEFYGKWAISKDLCALLAYVEELEKELERLRFKLDNQEDSKEQD